jgi:hypothetical protein
MKLLVPNLISCSIDGSSLLQSNTCCTVLTSEGGLHRWPRHVMETYGEMEAQLRTFVWALRGGEWPVSRSGRGTRWIGAHCSAGDSGTLLKSEGRALEP